MKEFFKAFRFFFSGYFNSIASLASVIGLLALLFKDKNAIIIALCSLVVFLIIVLLRFFYVTQFFLLQKTEKGYHKFATYVRYSTDDAKHITYELHKYLQCKCVAMDEYVHEFHWSGSKPPKITSQLQTSIRFEKTEEGQFDKAHLKFPKPLTYNDFTIVHMKMDLDDSDQRSAPYCEQAVRELVQLLSFRVELRYAEKHADAKITKKRINAQVQGHYDDVGFAKFDTSSRAYEYTIFTPEVGYFYRIEWER